MIALRPETPEDDALLRKVYAAAQAEDLHHLSWTEIQKSQFLNMQFDLQRQHYRTHYPDADFMLITRQQQAIGRWYLHRAADHFHLLDMSLLPEYRNQGIGSLLLTQLQSQAAAAAKPITLFVVNGNRAYHLYAKHQFEIVDRQPVHSQMEWRP